MGKTIKLPGVKSEAAIDALNRFREEVLMAKLDRGEDATREGILYHAAARAIVLGQDELVEPILAGKTVSAHLTLAHVERHKGRVIALPKPERKKS